MNILLLRGLGRVQEHWLNFPDQLVSTGHKIFHIDLPGFGSYAHVETPVSIARHAEFLREEFKKTVGTSNDPTQWAIVGLSLGGMVVLEWVSKWPGDFSKAIVINTSARDVGTLLQRLSAYALYRLSRAVAATDLHVREREVLKMIANLKSDDASVLQSLVEISKKYPTSKANLAKQLFAASQFKCPTKVDVPLLVIGSIKDRMVDVRCSKAIAERFNSPIKFHENAGHDLPIDDPEWLADRVSEFVIT